MKRLICRLLIFVLLLPAAFVASAQDPFGAAVGRQETTRSLLKQFSNAIIEIEDTDKIKDQLFEMFVFELVRQGDITALETLAKRGDKLSYRDSEENTLLHVAASAGAEGMVRFLIKSGLDVDADNAASRSPLFLAADANHLGTAKLLLKSEANVNGNSQLSHPLNTAAWHGHTEMATLLLDQGADINQRDVDGNTALHKAVWQAHFAIVQRLLQYDADPTAKNDAGQTPQSLAISRLKESKAGKTGKRRWGTEQVCGPPDAEAGDDALAWASKTQDDQAEWLIVRFENAVVPLILEIYENHEPKAVTKITVFDSAGKEHKAWAGKDPAKPGANGVHVASIELDTKIKSNKFRLHIDSVAVKGWNEIDAVGLTGADGKRQWVTSAEASSCYASDDFPWIKHQRIHDLIVKKD